MTSKDIKQPNILVDASYSLTIAQKLIMLTALRSVDTFSDVPERDYITIDLRQLYEDTHQIIARHSFYKQMVRGMHKLLDSSVQMPDNKDHRIGWIQECDANKNQSTIQIKLTSPMASLMTELSNNGSYTAINYRSAMLLRSPHAIRIYELLKHWSNTKKVITYEASDLREKLGLQDKYENVAIFKKEVLQKAIAQINQYTELEVQLDQVKNGREISKYKFTLLDHNKKQETLPKKGNPDLPKTIKHAPNRTSGTFTHAQTLVSQALEKQGISY